MIALRENIHPQETVPEIDVTLGFVGEELGSDLMKPVAALGDDACGDKGKSERPTLNVQHPMEEKTALPLHR